jgi:peptidoglycan/LPS O-acetylase OafA/YrhL
VQKTHINEVDYLRVIGLLSIVIIHAFGFYLAMPVSGPAARIFQEFTVNLLRFGRYIFMFVTGMVLFYGYDGRKLNAIAFFRRRLKTLVIPYMIWTAIYLLIDRWSKVTSWPNTWGFITLWAQNLISGNAYSHLYYILVAIQFYFFFPLFLAVFKPQKPRLAAGVILAGGLVLFGVYHYLFELHPFVLTALGGRYWSGILSWFIDHKDHIIISYLPFYLLGGLAGLYLEVWRQWLREHRGVITAVLILGTGLVAGEYFYLYRHMGESWAMTVSVFKPSMYVYSLGIIALSFRLAQVLDKRKAFRPLISLLAANSLGIYLIHPAVLYVVHSYLWRYQYLPGSVLVILDLALAVTASCLVSWVLGLNRYTRFVVGEAGNLRGKPPAVKQVPAVIKVDLGRRKHLPPTGIAG